MNQDTTHSIEDLDTDPVDVSFADLYAKLLEEDELLVTIPAEAEEQLRKGLASHKYKLNEKLKKDGMMPDSASLEFQVTPSKAVEGAINVLITLKKKATIKIFSLSKPDNEF